jgi:hypothetical protein
LGLALFPSRYYLGILKEDPSIALSKLEKVTLLHNQYIVDWSTNTFNGKIQDNSFEVTLSKKYYGAVYVFKGTLKNKHAHLKIQLKRTYKWIFAILFMYPLVGLILSFFLEGFETFIALIFPSVMIAVFFRISLEIGLIFISKKGLRDLTKVLGVNSLEKLQKNSL